MNRLLISTMTLFNQSPTLFDNLVIPEGMNRDVLVDSILFETASLSVVYTSPDIMQGLIGVWSRKRIYVWTELFKTLLYQYDPISNYDRTEERIIRNDHIGVGKYSDSGESDGTTSDTRSDQYNNKVVRTPDLLDTTHDTTTGDVKHNVAAFNTTAETQSWHDVTESNSDGTLKKTGTETEESNGSSSGTNKGTSKGTQSANGNNRDESSDFTAEKIRSKGNIGVTTTQQMIEAQRKIVEFDMYNYIIQDYKKEFCLGIY